MAITNNYNLPKPIYDAITSGRKRPEPGRIGVTSLIGSPLRRILTYQHWGNLVEDASDGLWALLGRSVHSVLEKHGGDGAEIKLEVPFRGMIIVGIIDSLRDNILSDYKVSSVWSHKLGLKSQWEAQVNVYRWLAMQSGLRVDELRIMFIVRDWNKKDARKDSSYPQIPFIDSTVPIWAKDKIQDYISEQVDQHAMAEELLRKGEPIPECSEKEKWTRPTTYAVAHAENDRAMRVFPTETEAIGYIVAKGLSGYTVWKRPGENVRCNLFCNCKNVCPYMQGNNDIL